ncbi:MAG: C40 family peptidase [Saprospiraceae bacterium]
MKKPKVKIPKTHGICKVSVAPIRKKPNDESEMISQLLYGELITVINKKNKSWVKVSCEWDNYVGWMDPKQLIGLTEEEFEKHKLDRAFALEIAQPITDDSISFPILAASSLPRYDGMTFRIQKHKIIYSGQVITADNVEITPELLIKVARKYINAPYLWGGRSPFGIDCSGFTQSVFKIFGIKLPRDAYQQADLGEMVDFVASSNVGDIAFFVNKEGRIHHVGIILEDNYIIHAAGMVRIDKLDHFGIYHKGKRSYTHTLRFIKRIL